MTFQIVPYRPPDHGARFGVLHTAHGLIAARFRTRSTADVWMRHPTCRHWASFEDMCGAPATRTLVVHEEDTTAECDTLWVVCAAHAALMREEIATGEALGAELIVDEALEGAAPVRTWRVVTAGPVHERDFETATEMREWVESQVPMKRGWTREWSEALETQRTRTGGSVKRDVHRLTVFNSKGARVNGVAAYIPYVHPTSALGKDQAGHVYTGGLRVTDCCHAPALRSDVGAVCEACGGMVHAALLRPPRRGGES